MAAWMLMHVGRVATCAGRERAQSPAAAADAPARFHITTAAVLRLLRRSRARSRGADLTMTQHRSSTANCNFANGAAYTARLVLPA